MASDYEKLICRAVRLRPAILREDGLTTELFQDRTIRRLFEGNSEIFEEQGGDDPIDIVILADRTGVPVKEILRLEEGCQDPHRGAIEQWTQALRQENASREAARLGTRLTDAFTKRQALDLETLDKLAELRDRIRNAQDKRKASGFVGAELVDPIPAEWLWQNYIPLRKGTLLSSDPGDGKTFLALDFTARVSRGSAWPDGAPGDTPASIIYLSLEDDADDTLRPRIDSLGGDPSKVAFLSGDREELFNLQNPTALRLLEAEVKRRGDVRLVVVDPAADFSGRTKTNSNEEVRAFLKPLIEIAKHHIFAVLLILHLNKDMNQRSKYRTAGTVGGWLGRARAAFYVFEDPDDPKEELGPSTKILHCQKANLAPIPPRQLKYRLREGRVIWEIPNSTVDPDENLGETPAEGKEAHAAEEWLRVALEDGPMDVKDIMRMGSEAKLSQSAIYRAKKKLSIKPRTHGFGELKTTIWQLPGSPS